MSYLDQPCERCGSKKKISKTWKETINLSSGTSTVEVAQITCSNKACQKQFDEDRAVELVKINERKMAKEASDKVRKESIARTIATRNSIKKKKK